MIDNQDSILFAVRVTTTMYIVLKTVVLWEFFYKTALIDPKSFVFKKLSSRRRKKNPDWRLIWGIYGAITGLIIYILSKTNVDSIIKRLPSGSLLDITCIKLIG